MNLVELDRALRQLRLSGIATVLETASAKRSQRRWRRLTWYRPSSPTNSGDTRTGSL